MCHPLRNQPKTTTEPVGIFPEEQRPIGSVVTDILSFRQKTDGHRSKLCIIDLAIYKSVFVCMYLSIQEMLEMSCIEFWRYSNITCCGYPLGKHFYQCYIKPKKRFISLHILTINIYHKKDQYPSFQIISCICLKTWGSYKQPLVSRPGKAL